MQHGAVLLNFSREGMVDDAAVLEGAATPSACSCYVTRFPGGGAARAAAAWSRCRTWAPRPREAEDNCAVMVVDQVRDYLEHGNIRNAVNFPGRGDAARVALPRGDRQRQRAEHAGADLARDGAGRGLNIHNMLNKSQGRDGLHAGRRGQRGARGGDRRELARIEGVLAVRYLPAERMS